MSTIDEVLEAAHHLARTGRNVGLTLRAHEFDELAAELELNFGVALRAGDAFKLGGVPIL